jgi:hypothetical protein
MAWQRPPHGEMEQSGSNIVPFLLGMGLVVVLLAFLGFMYVRISLQRPALQPPAFNPAAVTATAAAVATASNQR